MDARRQLNAALAGRYEIEGEIGRGGMATVYLARDIKHNRKVALKLLDPELGAVLGGERFLSEIRVTANLQHPNLLPLFDSGETGGLLYYVMPFVDGESLRTRLDREKQLPVDEAVRLAVAMASALHYAHQHGVIHRDLKPENILLQAGQPVIADFGIALAVSNAGGARVTQTGLSLGTPQYMSPEQATGDRAIDGRTDIYSLAAVLYEMLAGEPPHSGTSAQAIIAKLMTTAPLPLRSLRPTVPPNIAMAVEKALAKLPADRFGSPKEFAEALTNPAFTLTTFAANGATPRAVRWPWLPWTIAAACAVLLAANWLHGRATPAPAPALVRFTIGSVDDGRGRIEAASISPDGQTIVIAARTGDSTALWIRRLDELVPHRLAGSEGATKPFFSPDGKWVGFLAVDGNVHKLSIEGGTATIVAKMANPSGIVWASPDTIVAGMDRFSDKSGLTRMTADGSGSSMLTTPAREMHHRPVVTPDGRSVLFSLITQNETKIGIASLSTGRFDSLTIPNTHFASPFGMIDGSVLYRDSSDAIWSVPAELSVGRTTGQPARVDADVEARGASELDVARNGTLLFTHSENRRAIIAVRPPQRPDTLLGNQLTGFAVPRWAPDGQAVAMIVVGQGAEDPGLFVLDRRSHTSTQVATWQSELEPTWSSDGTRIMTTLRETGDSVAWWQWRDGRRAPERLASAPAGWGLDACAPSSDDRLVVMEVSNSHGHALYVSAQGSPPSDARPFAADASHPRWSPDGKWIVYQANINGKSQIFAQGYPSGGRVQLSDNGGTHPVWPRGSTLYYEIGRDIMATDVDETAGGLRVAKRRRLWQGASSSERGDSPFVNYDVSPSGELLTIGAGDTGPAEVVVELNWANRLKGNR